MDPNADTKLIVLLQQDDVSAFDALYWKYHQSIHANVLKLTKDIEAAKDILQEVFVTLWEKRFTLDTNQPVANWLFVVSYNKSVSYLKRSLKESVIKRLD